MSAELMTTWAALMRATVTLTTTKENRRLVAICIAILMVTIANIAVNIIGTVYEYCFTC